MIEISATKHGAVVLEIRHGHGTVPPYEYVVHPLTAASCINATVYMQFRRMTVDVQEVRVV